MYIKYHCLCSQPQSGAYSTPNLHWDVSLHCTSHVCYVEYECSRKTQSLLNPGRFSSWLKITEPLSTGRHACMHVITLMYVLIDTFSLLTVLNLCTYVPLPSPYVWYGMVWYGMVCTHIVLIRVLYRALFSPREGKIRTCVFCICDRCG